MRRSAFIGGAAALAAAGPLVARAQTIPGTNYVQQLNLAVSLPLSGPYEPYGHQIATGARAAVDENNMYAAPLERVFAVRELDDEGTLAIAMSNIDIATADPSVVAMIGNFNADVIVGALPQYASVGMPLIVPATTSDSVTQQNYRNVFRLPPGDSVAGGLFAEAVMPLVKPSFALAVSEHTDYGTDISRGFVDSAKSKARRVDTYALPDSPDFVAAAQTIVAMHPDYLYLGGKPATIGALVPALTAAGYKGAFGLCDAFFSDATIKQFGSAFEGAYVAASTPPLQRVPADFHLLADYTRQYGAMTPLAAYGYSAAQVAIAAVKSTSATTRFATLTALERGTTFTTLLGPMSFDFNGNQLQPNIYLYTIGGGSFTFRQAARPSSFVL